MSTEVLESPPAVESEQRSLPKEIDEMEELWRLVEPAYSNFTSVEKPAEDIDLSQEQIEAVFNLHKLRDMVSYPTKTPEDLGDGWERNIIERTESQIKIHVTPSALGGEDGDVMVRYSEGNNDLQLNSSIANSPARRVGFWLDSEGRPKLKIVRQINDKEVILSGGLYNNEVKQSKLKLTEVTVRHNPSNV